MRNPKRTFKYEPDQVRAEVEAILKLLPGWKLKESNDPSPHDYVGEIVRENDPNYRISIGLRNAPNRYSAENFWPYGPSGYSSYSVEHLSISTDFQRGPEAFADAIKKKLIPYIDLHIGTVLDEIQHEKDRIKTHKSAVDDLCKVFDRRPSPHYPNVVDGRWGIFQVSVNESGERALIDMSRTSFPIDFIKKFAAFMKENSPERQ